MPCSILPARPLSFVALLVILGTIVACADQQRSELVIRFAAEFDGATANCATPIGADGSIRLTDFRFYVSEVQLRAADGQWISASLPDSGNGVSLIDFEDAGGPCVNGTTDTKDTIKVELPDRQYDALRFSLGVPFVHNHADPLSAEPPLNEPAMHWHWQSGYKFLRLGLSFAGERWHVHLGSTGCSGPVGAVTACARPNRAVIEIDNWSPERTVTIAIDALVAGIDTATGNSGHCLGDHENPTCRAVLQNLGLNPDTGSADSPASAFGIGD